MQKAVHAMRLRSRSGPSRSVNMPSTVTAPDSEAAGEAFPRSVLGDVSNKRSAPTDGKRHGGHKGLKKLKTSVDTSKPISTTNVHNENNLNRSVTDENIKQGVGRKLPGRLTRKSATRPKRPRLLSKSVSQQKELIIIDSDSVGESQTREDTEDKSTNRINGDNALIPEEFRIQRHNFDGTNFTLGLAPHDRKDKDDVLLVANYVTDLFQHLYRAETESAPGTYMSQQRDVNAKMRAILVDWLVEVHMKFRLVPETLYLCVNLIDRYCNIVSVARSKLQLVGVTALLIACKYEEIYPPEVRDCVYITDRAYSRQEVLDMEQDILQRLQFKITVPTAYPFLLRFLSVTNASSLVRYAAHYYMERMLQEHDLLCHRPSLVCAASVILALNNPDIQRQENGMGTQTPGILPVLLEYTEFDSAEILECAEIIARKVGEEPVTASRRQLVAVKRKYDNRKYLHVSTSLGLPDHNHILSKYPDLVLGRE